MSVVATQTIVKNAKITVKIVIRYWFYFLQSQDHCKRRVKLHSEYRIHHFLLWHELILYFFKFFSKSFMCCFCGVLMFILQVWTMMHPCSKSWIIRASFTGANTRRTVDGTSSRTCNASTNTQPIWSSRWSTCKRTTGSARECSCSTATTSTAATAISRIRARNGSTSTSNGSIPSGFVNDFSNIYFLKIYFNS